MPAVLAAGGQRCGAGGQDLVVGLLQLGVAGRRRADPSLLEDRLVVPAADAEGDERHPGLHPVEGHALDGGGVDAAVPAELLVVRAEIERLLGLGERGTDLTAPDSPHIRPGAAEQLGLQLVRVHRRARARQIVDRGLGPGLGVELRHLGLEQVDRLVTFVGEDAKLVGRRRTGRLAFGCGAGAGAEAGPGDGRGGKAEESSAGEERCRSCQSPLSADVAVGECSGGGERWSG